MAAVRGGGATLLGQNGCERRILVASYEPVYRAGLVAVVRQAGHYRAFATSAEPNVVLECLGTEEAFALLVVASDFERALRLIVRVRDQRPRLPVILVATGRHPGLLREGLRAGVTGVIAATSSASEIAVALDAIDTGGIFLSQHALELLDEPIERKNPEPPARELSPRQREVLALVARGLSTAEIADALGVSPRTIDSHRLAISKRLGIRRVADLIRYALREELVSA